MRRKFRDYFERKFVGLLDASYKLNMDYSGRQVQLVCRDEVGFMAPENDSFTVTVTRKIAFEPEGPFSISATYFIRHFLQEEFAGKFKWEKYDILKEIMKDKEYFLDDEVCHLSLIIAQLTSSFGSQPLITPPFLIAEKEPKKK